MGLMSGAVFAAIAATGCGWRQSDHRWGGWRHGWREDPAAAKEHARHMARWALRSVNATDDQRRRVDDIVSRLVDDIQPLAETHRANRDAMIAAFTGESVDRQALEQARQSDLELAAKAYGRFTDAFAEVGAVLTREQRLELAEAAHHFRHR
jgi:Spy/CpxP family protein refolding chaperone